MQHVSCGVSSFSPIVRPSVLISHRDAMKTLAAILLVLPIALVVASNGDCKSHASKTYKIGVSFSIKSPCECESIDEDQFNSTYMKAVEKICKKKGRCTLVDSFEGICTQASEYSVNITLSFPCPACKNNVNRVTKSLKKKKKTLKIGRKGGACRLKSSTVSTPELINCVRATEPPTTEPPPTTTAPPPTTTAPPPTTPVPIQATTPPPPIEYPTESGSQGVVTVSPRKCVTLCGECSFTNDPNVMVVLLSFTPKTPQCPGLTFSDGECNDNSPDLKPTYVEPHTHISKSRCACVCFPRTCPAKETVAKLFYSSYQAPLEEMLKFVLQLDEAQPLAQDEALLAKLTAALCDKSKALALVADPALAKLLRVVPPKYALQFLGRKRK